jgi:hypothetical protein
MNLIMAIIQAILYTFCQPRRRYARSTTQRAVPRERIPRPVAVRTRQAPAVKPVKVVPVALNTTEADVVSALVNMGCRKPQAEASVRYTAATMPGAGFDALFVKSLENVK